MRIGLALTTFFKVLFNRKLADEIRQLLQSATTDQKPASGAPAVRQAAPPKSAGRNDAITLLATLQREARFVDLVKESLDQYSDAQVGAAARDVLRDCGGVLDRMFVLKPVLESGEGADVETPSAFDAGRFRIVGNAAGDPPFRGALVHHGWEAAQCELPQWSGSQKSALVVAPAEIEVK